MALETVLFRHTVPSVSLAHRYREMQLTSTSCNGCHVVVYRHAHKNLLLKNLLFQKLTSQFYSKLWELALIFPLVYYAKRLRKDNIAAGAYSNAGCFGAPHIRKCKRFEEGQLFSTKNIVLSFHLRHDISWTSCSNMHWNIKLICGPEANIERKSSLL